MSNNDFVQMKTALLAQQDDVAFELFAVQQGVAPDLQDALQSRSNAVDARIRTVDSIIASQTRSKSNAMPRVSSMTKRQINAEFKSLMTEVFDN